MEPLKFAFPFSNWLLRLASIILVYIIFYKDFIVFRYNSLDSWIALAFAVSSILLFVGGYMKKPALTIITSILLVMGCTYEIFNHFVMFKGHYAALFCVFGAISLYFAASGNRKK